MAGRRRKPRAVRCPECGGKATWRENLADLGGGWQHFNAPGYACDCGWATDERDAQSFEDDGRIRSPEDALERLCGALEAAAVDGRLSELDRAVHRVYCTRAGELGWVEIMAGDAWVCERVGLDPATRRTSVRRSRARLGKLGYVKALEEAEVTHRGLKAQVAARKREGKRSATLLEVRKAPGYPTCDRCGGDIPDIERVSKRYCSDRCRKAAWRADPNPLRDEVMAMAERGIAAFTSSSR